MGEIVQLVPSVWHWWIPLGIGIGMLIAAEITALFGKGKVAVALLLSSILVAAVGTPYINQKYVKPQIQERTEVIMNQLQPTYEAYHSPFYLKESVSELGVQGEVRGKFYGFLFISGNIYGHIDSRRIMTIVYEDNDPYIDHYVGVHRSISFPLDEAVIVTIPAGERPYLIYSEAKLFQIRVPNRSGARQMIAVKLVPGTPHLYLPEGWKVL